MLKKVTQFLLVSQIIFCLVSAQDTTSKSSFAISFYADAYIAYYTDSLRTSEYQKFPTTSPRSEQIGLNVAMLSAKYASDRVRGTVSLHYGDVPRSTWSSTFNMIQEANVGVRLCKNFWVDAGFFRTHIGTEALFPKENITSSVSVGTYFEPYYQAGLKLSYAPCEKLALSLYALNGYNLFEDNNKKKSLGLLAIYTINDHLSIGYDNYIGDETQDGDNTNHLRFYNNAFLNYEKNKIKIVTGVDFGIQQNSGIEDAEESAVMFSALLAMRYMAATKVDIYGRAEICKDADGFLSGVFVNKNGFSTGLKIWGATLGVEYKPTSNSYIRLEGRDLIANSDQEIFYWDSKNTNTRLEVLLNLGVWFP